MGAFAEHPPKLSQPTASILNPKVLELDFKKMRSPLFKKQAHKQAKSTDFKIKHLTLWLKIHIGLKSGMLVQGDQRHLLVDFFSLIWKVEQRKEIGLEC